MLLRLLLMLLMLLLRLLLLLLLWRVAIATVINADLHVEYFTQKRLRRDTLLFHFRGWFPLTGIGVDFRLYSFAGSDEI